MIAFSLFPAKDLPHDDPPSTRSNPPSHARRAGLQRARAAVDAAQEALGRSTVVNAVTRLEKRGLVLREPATNDRRLVIVRITDAGRQAADEGSRRQAETINSLSWEITPEDQATVARLSRRLWLANAQRVRKTLESSPRVGEATV